MPVSKFDAVIIGSGQAGNPLAVKFAASGKKVALVEKEHIGGSCVNVGCSPTKTMEASGRVAHLVNRAADYGVTFKGPVTVDMETVRRRKRDIVTSFSSGDEAKLLRKGVEILWGEARFTSGQEIEVALNDGGTRLLKADLIFIDTGTRPAVPDIDGLPECSILNNGTIMELDRVPEHLMVIGGGYVGMEFARMFKRFGSEVTIVHRGAHVLSQEDEDLAQAIQEIFTRDGIRIILQADNLVKNATEALEGLPDPRLNLHVKRILNQVSIEITDNGCGIPDEVLKKIFVPFYSTKATGSGIGLSLSRQIIRNHGGQISVQSKEGVGTTFKVALPVS